MKITQEEALRRCYGCDFLHNNETCINNVKEEERLIITIEDCFDFTCPKGCSCNTQINEPFHCEVIPEELVKIMV